MKKLFCALGFIILFCLLNAQTKNYIIIDDSNSWTTLSYGLGEWNVPSCVSTEYVYFEGDSIFNALLYKKVYMCDDELHQNILFKGLIREENQKTYFFPPTSDREYLIYDFSLEVGMSFEYEDYLYHTHPPILLFVNSVDYIEINGEMRKRIELNGDTWVEGIGSMSGLLYPCYKKLTSGGFRSFLCFFQDKYLIYKNPEYDKCYYEKLRINEIPQDLIYIYTDESNMLHIVNAKDTPFFMYDIQGRIIKSIIPYDNNVILNLSHLSKGFYIVVNQSKSLTFKIIVK